MSAPPYMRLYWGDYHKRTRHLKRDQHGAYFLLIGEAWQLGGTLPDDDAKLAAWALCTPEEWASMKPVVMEFFALRRGKWWHDRVREELASYEATSRKRKEAGKKGGTVRPGNTTGNREANAYQLPTKPEPEPEPYKKEQEPLSPTPTKAAYPEDFEAAWKLYPHHTRRSSKPDSLSQWRKLSPAARASLPAACARYRRLGAEPKGECGAPAMERWLKRGLHLNWVEDAEPAATEGPADTAVIARRLRHYRDTGAWEPTWGPRPGMTDDQTRNEGKAA